MKFENVSVLGVAQVEAPIRVTSAALADRLMPTLQRLGIRPDLLEMVSGIVARRFWPKDTQPSDAATMAARKVIEDFDVDADRLGALVSTSVCKDYIEPSVACLVHGNLGLSADCMNFDLGNACLAFLDGMDVVGNMIERGQIDYGIVVDGEGSRDVIERTIERLLDEGADDEQFRDEFATLTLGSGAVAMVLCRSDLEPDAHRFTGGVRLAATEHNRLCLGSQDRMVTDTRRLLAVGLELAQRTWDKAVRELEWTLDRFDALAIHQVSRIHTERLVQTIGLQMDQVVKIYPEYGNVGPASVPMALAIASEDGRLKKGDRVALLGIGSGLNCAMAELVW